MNVKEASIKDMLFKEADDRREYHRRQIINAFLLSESALADKEEIHPQQNEPWSREWKSPEPIVPELSTPEPEIPVMKKPKPTDAPPIDYVQKNKNKRRLIRQPFKRTLPYLGSTEERLQKIANKLDQHGELRIADKIDLLLQKIKEEENV
jgi:hypothetical protein